MHFEVAVVSLQHAVAGGAGLAGLAGAQAFEAARPDILAPLEEGAEQDDPGFGRGSLDARRRFRS